MSTFKVRARPFTSFFVLLSTCVIAGQAQALPIFSDTFNTYTSPNGGYTQYQTGLKENYGGSLFLWNSSGFNAIHAVDRTGAGDWAIMLYNGNSSNPNEIHTKTAIAANVAGTTYQVSFLAAGAVYGSPPEATTAGDMLGFVVTDANSATVLDYNYMTPAFAGANNPFNAGGFTYVGNGIGNVNVQIIGRGNSSQFGGAVDNFAITAVPEPASLAILGLGVMGIAAMQRRKFI